MVQSQTHTFEGKTIDEAIEEAKRALNAEMDEIDIRVIDHGNQKRFPFGRSRAKIAVSLTESNDETWETWLDNEIEDQDLFDIPLSPDEKQPVNTAGTAWIIDGQLHFHQTAEKKPILVIPYDGEVYNHNEKLSGRHVLKENDVIDFHLETTLIETKWTVKVNDKEQTVTLTVTPGKKIIPYIADHPAASVIEPIVQFDEQVNNQLQTKDVYEQLANMEVIEGIDDAAIHRACSAGEEQTVTIASGKLPKDGKNGEMAFRIDIQERSLPYKEKHDGTADFRESLYIPSVEHGEVLAEVIDPLPGEDGISVFGDVLQAKDGKPVIIKAGSGIEIDEEQSAVIAAQSGRPLIEQSGLLFRMSILPKKRHPGDLSIKHGNIRFIGDVEITGDVNEGMTVEAEGNVQMQKNVMHSTIQSRQNILIHGNAIVSAITAGQNQAVYDALQDIVPISSPRTDLLSP
ncbi:flagellar assembly protein A [Salisediminibacterium halotolerans]|uniref:RNA-binding protein KhpB N-terminal domain-containing protein n=1 Tax=Salisediminibacterium halotolerans TaxID=517425 RepID=A0A1H9SNM3_9BACI|nr:FapA family protein [Salisediminibacterium haloalkalitolerans]SER85909.1 hypothetical protein SAMN05444126_10761 [Salisediminibacterium haloalkalitolerans]